jgi:hypothetical protein
VLNRAAVRWWAGHRAFICGYRFVQRDWEHSYFSANLPRTLGTDILDLVPVALGYVMHGPWDLSHCLSGSSLAGLSITEIPLGYGIFTQRVIFLRNV